MAPAPVSLPLGRRSGPRVRFGVLGPWGASGQGWGPLGESFSSSALPSKRTPGPLPCRNGPVREAGKDSKYCFTVLEIEA